MGFGAVFAVASFTHGVISGGKREEEIRDAQARQAHVEQVIRQEQAVRERKSQLLTGKVLEAQSINIQRTSGSGAAADTNIAGARAAVAANVTENLARINESLASSGALSSARQRVLSAGKPSTFDTFARQVQPAIFSNIENIDSFFGDMFSSSSGSPAQSFNIFGQNTSQAAIDMGIN